MEQKELFKTKLGFILAAVGYAVGLGNIWRFPYVAYENGGGAFLVPYLFALLTTGIPLVILEYTIGHKYRGSGPLSFFRISPKWEWIGWWQVLISFIVSTYFAVIVAWAVAYLYFSIGRQWGSGFDAHGKLATEHFFYNDYLKISGGEFELGGVTLGVILPLLFVWFLTMGILYRGVRRGIELANKVFIPLLVILMAIIVLRGITLPGAGEGLNDLFQPDWTAMLSGDVWAAAYGQIFFSVGVSWSLFIVFASYLPRKSDINNSALVTAFSNSGFELFAAIGVFATLGFLATQMNASVHEVVDDGIGLAFIVFPEIINQFPVYSTAFGLVFFLSLVVAGLSTLVSICEAYVAAVMDKFHLSRSRAVTYSVGLSALISILFSTGGGLYFLDAIDYFMNNFGLLLAGLAEAVFVVWIIRKADEFQDHANAVSDLPIGGWFKLFLGVFTPIALGYIAFSNFKTNVMSLYGGYKLSFVLIFGWGSAVLAIVSSLLLMKKSWPQMGEVHYVEGKERNF